MVCARANRRECRGNLDRVVLDLGPARCGQNEDGELPPSQSLLVAQILIRGDQYIKRRSLRGRQELTVVQCRPAAFERGLDLVTDQYAAQWRRRTLIEENLHRQ